MTKFKFKVGNCFRNTILFGAALAIMLIADLLTLFGVGFYQAAADTMFAANIVLNIAVFSDLIVNIRRDFPLLIFVGSFDILLLGRVYVSYIGHYSEILYFLEAESFKNLFWALQVVTLSLLCIYTAYKLAAPLFSKREKALAENGKKAVSQYKLLPVIRQISMVILFVSSLAFFFTLLQAILNVFKNGYLGSFTQESQNIPTAISRLSMFFAPSFAVFLSTLPSRKQMKFPFIVYGVYMLASLFTGRRGTFVCEALMILIYFVMRDNLLEKNKRIFKKRTVILGAVILVAAMYLLQLFAELRAGSFVSQKGFSYMIVNFFHSQGASFRVVIQTVNKWDYFDHNNSYKYLFYPFELFAHNNIVIRTLFGLSPIVEVQNLDFVRSTHNFAHVLTYMVDRSRYIAGGGFGTSFVAEAYVAYGIPGVAVVSMIVGLVLRFFSSMLTRSWVVLSLCLIAIKDFVYIPRSFAFLWVTDVFNLTYLCLFIAIYLLAAFIARVGTHVRKAPVPADTAPLAEEKT